MKLVMTLLARDEADIVDAQIAFHLHAGVDFVIATDNLSEDGTTEILERYERAGVLHLIREDGAAIRQGEWVTRMARLAATELGADWVINSDADEFWWPRGGTLRDVLAAIPRRFGSVRGCWRHFVPRPGDGRPFAERMVVRLTRPHHPGEKTSIYHAHQKVAHRADPSVSVETGNHEVIGRGLQPLRGWLPIEVLHFSLRSVEQIERKGRSGWYVGRDPDLAEHQIRLGHAVRAGRGRGFLDAVTVDDAALERGLADGTLAIDTRLRDALRGIRGPDGSFSLPVLGAPPVLSFDRPSASDDALLAAEVAPLADIDGVVRAGERVAALDLRLARLEREPLARLRRLARP